MTWALEETGPEDVQTGPADVRKPGTVSGLTTTLLHVENWGQRESKAQEIRTCSQGAKRN